MPVPTQGIPPGDGVQQANSALQQGVAALQAGQLDAAQKAFQDALRSNPKSVEALMGLADLAYRQRNETELLRRLQQAEQLAPQRVDVQTLLGRVYLGRKEFAKAEQSLRKALQLDPKAMAARLALADTLMQQNKLADALPLLQAAAEAEPRNATVAQALGDLHFGQGNKADAERQWRRAAELDPKNPAPWMSLARAAGDPKAALALVSEAARRAPDKMEVLLARAQLQMQLKDRAGARESLQQAAKADPKTALPWVHLGMLDEADGKRGEARRHYLAALERDAQQPIALNNLVMLGLLDNEDPARLEVMARRAVKAMPQNAAVHDTLARTLRLRRDKPGAVAAASEAVRLAPKDASMRLLLAELQQWAGNAQAARQSAEQVLALQAQGELADKARALIAKL